MTRFDEAFDYTYQFEVGLDDDPDDPGGITNDGITVDDLTELGLAGGGDIDGDYDIDADDIRKMSTEDKKRAYKELYWERLGLDEIENQAIAIKIFDTAVNLGRAGAANIVQRMLNDFMFIVGLKNAPLLKVDGSFGPKTRERLNQLGQPAILCLLSAEQARIYRAIVTGRPQSQKYLAGWFRRAYSRLDCVVERI
ncbi:hypothetical protein LLG95_05310 [bacterium]|nr:hypothetical protein [bacterium]